MLPRLLQFMDDHDATIHCTEIADLHTFRIIRNFDKVKQELQRPAPGKPLVFTIVLN